MRKKLIFRGGLTMSYAQDVLAKLKEKNASEPEFIQARTRRTSKVKREKRKRA